jgi:two-component system, LuxR family, sensor kinase FixL
MDGPNKLSAAHGQTDALATAGERDYSLFRTLIRTTENGVLVMDRDGRVLVYNQACRRIFQFPSEEVLGGPVDLLVSPPYRRQIRDCFRAALQTDSATPLRVEHEVQGLKRDGSLFPIHLVIGQGELEGEPVFLVVVQDQTALLRERIALDQEKAYLALIVESSNDAIISYALDGTVVSWNPAAEKMFGFRAEEIVGATAASLMPQFVPPEMIPAESALLQRVLAGATVPPHETTRFHKDGTPVHVLLTASPIRDAAGAVIGIARTVRDITERKKYEHQRALLNLAIDNSDDAFTCIALDGTNLTWNRGAEKILGWSPQEVVGRNAQWIITTIVPPTLQAMEFEYSRRAAAGEKIGPYDTIRIRKDGSKVHVSSTVYPVKGPGGEVLAIVRTLHDITDRLDYERQRSLLSAVVDSSIDAIISYALDGTITSWNPAAEMMYGYKAEEMLGSSLYGRLGDFMPPEKVAEEREVVARVIAGERVAPYEAVRIRKDGSEVHVLVSVSPVKDANGLTVGTSRVVRDISERKVFERQRALLSAAVESSTDSIITYDLEGTITSWNPAAEITTGHKADEMIGKNLYGALANILSPEKIAEEKRNVARILAGERVPPYEVVRVRDDGSEAYVLVSVSPIKDASGAIIGTSRVVRDITERKVFERQRALLSAIVESSNDAVFTKTLGGIVTSWNAAAEAMFGYSATDIVGCSMLALVPDDLLDEERANLERIRDGETIRHFETTRKRKDGSSFAVSLTLSPVRDADGRVTGASSTIRDITDRKTYESRLESMRVDMIHVARVHELSQVSAGIAHELNQPLAAMLNYSNVARRLVEHGGDLAKLPDVAAKIGDQAERAAQIIRRMRDFVEKRAPHRAVVDISAVADDAIALALIGTKAASIDTHILCAADVRPVLADRVQVQQVLVNLLRNATEAMAVSERRVLTLSMHNRDARTVEISVADTGAGISDEIAERLFSPFVTTKADGMGIGLAISKQIIEAHGGSLTVRPNPAGGTVFEFTLPAADQSAFASSSE